MKKTLSIILAVLLMLCTVPAFCVFAAEDEFATIDSPEEFAAFTKALNDGSYAPSGIPTILVTTDLDMRNITDFQPINKLELVDIDFQGHTIYNLVATASSTEGGKSGMIAHNSLHRSIYDVNLYNCMFISNGFERAALVVGGFDRGGVTGVNVENCTVKAVLTEDESKVNKVVSAVVGGYDYGQFDMEVSVKNVVLDCPNAVAFCSVIGTVYSADYIIYDATIENVTSIKGDQTAPVEKMLGLGSADRSYLKDLVSFDDCEVSISNTATATGYSGAPVNQEQLPEKPVETPVTTTTPTTTTKAPITTKAPTTTAPTTTVAGDDEKGGCKSFAGASVAFVALMTAAGCALLKKKED